MARDAEGKNESKAAETISEDRMAENFTPNDKTHQATDSRIRNTSKIHSKYITLRLLKTKDNLKILKGARGKKDTCLPKE